jgi:hypothetical protein
VPLHGRCAADPKVVAPRLTGQQLIEKQIDGRGIAGT